jgi:hypothetical protein
MSEEEYEGWDGFTANGDRARFNVTAYDGNVSGWVVFLRLGDEQDWTFDVDQASGLGRDLIKMAERVRSLNQAPRDPIA